jgi:hypothetical protein
VRILNDTIGDTIRAAVLPISQKVENLEKASPPNLSGANITINNTFTPPTGAAGIQFQVPETAAPIKANVIPQKPD